MLKKYNKMNDITKILIAMLLGSLLGILLGGKGYLHWFYRNNLAESDENVPCSHCHLHDGKGDYQYG